MGFLDKLEKFANKVEEFGQKADKWLDDNTKPEYSQSELLEYYIDNFGRLFYDTILSSSQKKDSRVEKLNFSRKVLGKRTIQKVEESLFHIEIKCSNIWAENEYGKEFTSFVLSLNIFANKYAELDYSKKNTVEVMRTVDV